MGLLWKLDVLRHLARLKSEQRLDRDNLERIQAERLAAIVEAASRTRHYSRILSLGIERPGDLSRLPSISKDDVLRSPGSFINPGEKGPLIETKSSGYSGKQLRVLLNREVAVENDAAKYCFLTDFGLGPADFFAETTIFRDKPAIDIYGICRRLRLPVLGKEEEHLALLRRHGVNALRAFPSIASVLAKLNAESPHPLGMKFVNCGAETLGPAERRSIESSFSSEVFMNYGITEFGYAAWECPEHSLHVNSSSVILEIVDGKGRPKRNGPGEIALTTLNNRAMPLLRYRTGDRGSWGKDCACGRGGPVLGSVEGRLADAIALPSGRLCPSIKFYFPSDMKADCSGIRQYQLVQTAPSVLVFRFVPLRQGPGPECLAEIKAKVMRAAGEEISVEFEETDSIPRAPGGKFRPVVPLRR
jgi:phenylacetate-CoA ligase